jgi:hypothetical protein
LSPKIYEEVEADRRAFLQALSVVVLSHLAAVIGAAGWVADLEVLLGLVGVLFGWFLWAGLTYLVGTRVLPEPTTEADWGQLLRTVGFAASPGIIRLLGLVTTLTAPVFFFAQIWMLAAFVVAVRQALDYRSTLRAVAVCALGWAAYTGVVYGVQFLFAD